MLQSKTILIYLMTYRYVALLPLASIEGPVVALIVGFLTRLGYFNFFIAFLIMIIGDFIPDSIYYAIGYFGDKEKIIAKYDTKSKIISKHIHFLENNWSKHIIKTMFVSKLAYGFSIPLLVSAGLVKVPYKKFIWHALHVTILQYGIIMSIGYLLGHSYASATRYIQYVEIAIAVLVLILFGGYIAFTKYMRRKIIEIEQQNLYD